jgi:hypothetical protein
MTRGICRLCQEEKDLQKSHYMPAGVYRPYRQSTKGSTPLVITRKYLVQTTEQMSDYLLCADCEQLFNLNGERWTLARIARPEGFALRTSVLNCPYRVLNAEVRYYVTRGAKDIDHEKLVYFALSVFWRGAVRTWTRSGDTTDEIDLGEYGEPIRLFLLGKAPYPKDVVVIASLWPFDESLPAIYHPRQARPTQRLKGHNLFFYVPGLSFNLVAGEALSPAIRHLCMYSSPLRMMFMSEKGAKALHNLTEFHLSKPRRTKGRLAAARSSFRSVRRMP